MSDALGKNELLLAEAERELAHLGRQTIEARAALALLQEDVLEAQSRLVENQSPSELLEANVQLVLGILRAQNEAEITAKALSEISRIASVDELTNLPNRRHLLQRVERTIANSLHHEEHFALLFLDLNNFKKINDTLGHPVGDSVLRHAAQCLALSVRETDIVSRYGGDEFLILLGKVSRKSDAALVANKIIADLSAPLRVGEHVLHLAVSIGISFYPEDGNDTHTLINRADAAMYRAKRYGTGGFQFHDNA